MYELYYDSDAIVSIQMERGKFVDPQYGAARQIE